MGGTQNRESRQGKRENDANHPTADSRKTLLAECRLLVARTFKYGSTIVYTTRAFEPFACAHLGKAQSRVGDS